MKLFRHVSKYFDFGVCVSAFAFLCGCAQGPFGTSWQAANSTTGNGASGGPSAGLTNAYEQQALAIIQTNCTSCHSSSTGPAGVYDLTDPNHLVSGGMIVPGQPSQSVLYNAITSGIMPPGGALAQSDQQTLNLWITAAAEPSTPTPTPAPTPRPTATPNPTPTPTPSPTPISSISFKNLESTIFQPKCVGCHSAGHSDGGYAFDSYSGVKNAVNLGTPTSSAVYAATNSGAMPQGGSRLTSSQESQILQWIKNGAPNN